MRRALLGVVVSLLVVACGSDTAEADVCAEVADLRSSAQALADLEPGEVEADEVEEALDEAGQDLEDVREAAGTELSDEANTLRLALDHVGETLQRLEIEGPAVVAPDLQAALVEVRSAWDVLRSSAATLGC